MIKQVNTESIKKFSKSRKPGSSIRNYADEICDLENLDKRSKLSKLPKRTYSLEGKENAINRRSGNPHQSSTTSMIPRPERKKFSRRLSSPATSQKEYKCFQRREKEKLKHPQSASNAQGGRNVDRTCKTKESPSQTVVKPNLVEGKLDEDFAQFKQNILKIPEFWSDADQTVKNILKNAVSIVTKQYPTADVEAFELEIQNILKATEVVKQEILTKTEDIVNQANKIYNEGYSGTEPTDEELRLIAEKMEELRNDVRNKNNMIGDLFKCGTTIDVAKTFKFEGKGVKNGKKEQGDEEKSEESNRKLVQRRLASKKSKMRMDEGDDGVIQSCGDILRQDAKTVARLLNESVRKSPRDSRTEDKSCQTMSLWASEIVKREESLKALNDQILQLHQLCKDHITKFKSFNFQIKLRGICNKAAPNALQGKDAMASSGKNKVSNYNCVNKDSYEHGGSGGNGNGNSNNSSKQRDVDVHQKNRLMSQQKKLIHVRDELIEMLKTRCNVEVEEI